MLQIIFQASLRHIFLVLQSVANSLSFNPLQFAVNTAAAILFRSDEQVHRTPPWKLLPQVIRKKMARRMLQFIFSWAKHKIGTIQNQAKKFINTDEKKTQYNPFPKPILVDLLDDKPGFLLTV